MKIKMTRIILLITCLLISSLGFAQTGFNYKAVIKDNNGNVVANQDITIRFSVVDVVGNIESQEIHSDSVTDFNGIVTANIGEGSHSLSYGYFHDLDWGSQSHFLKVEMDIAGGTNFVDMGTTEFKAVPYAKHAQTAANVSGLEQITEDGNTGWRLVGRNPVNYGAIGTGAVDLSYSINPSDVKGARGIYATALGYNSEASGYISTAIGSGAIATETASTAIGSGPRASGTGSLAMGSYTIASGTSSTAMGNNTVASGKNSTAMGIKTDARSYTETAIGSYTTSYVPASLTEWDENDRLFVIGNGQNPSTTNNAITVLKNGNVGIDSDDPQSLLELTHKNGAPTSNLKNAFSIRNSDTNHSWQFYTATYLNLYKNGVFKGSWNSNSGAYIQASDRRVKKDINPLENGTLNKVMQLNPVSYLMKDQTDTNRNLGLISQEVKELFPSITHYVKESDLLALSYTELIPILIKAIQEQQAIIEAQKTKDVVQDKSINEQNKTIEELVARLDEIEYKSAY